MESTQYLEIMTILPISNGIQKQSNKPISTAY